MSTGYTSPRTSALSPLPACDGRDGPGRGATAHVSFRTTRPVMTTTQRGQSVPPRSPHAQTPAGASTTLAWHLFQLQPAPGGHEKPLCGQNSEPNPKERVAPWPLGPLGLLYMHDPATQTISNDFCVLCQHLACDRQSPFIPILETIPKGSHTGSTPQ